MVCCCHFVPFLSPASSGSNIGSSTGLFLSNINTSILFLSILLPCFLSHSNFLIKLFRCYLLRPVTSINMTTKNLRCCIEIVIWIYKVIITLFTMECFAPFLLFLSPASGRVNSDSNRLFLSINIINISIIILLLLFFFSSHKNFLTNLLCLFLFRYIIILSTARACLFMFSSFIE